MSQIDHLDIDGRLLRLLVAVRDAGSVTGAAERLGLSQSAVSHQLERLRLIVGDPLFVKAGRGIVPTARAETLALQAEVLLDELRRFATAPAFDASTLRRGFTIAANDLQRDLLLPRLFERLRAQAPGVTLRVIASAIPSPEMLRDPACDLVVSPRPPDAADVVQVRLFDDAYRVFHDPAVRTAPRDLREYLDAEHVTVLYEPSRRLDIDEALAAAGVQRRFAVQVPGFAVVAGFLRGTARLATLPGLLQRGLLGGLASSAPPLACPSMPMYMLWHLRHRHEPVHRWLRETLCEVAAEVLGEAAGPRA